MLRYEKISMKIRLIERTKNSRALLLRAIASEPFSDEEEGSAESEEASTYGGMSSEP